MGIAIALALVIAIVLVLAAREVVVFRRTRETYSTRRLTLRLTTAFMLAFLLGSILLVLAVPSLSLIEPDLTPDLWLVFWGCVALLTGAIFCMIIADIGMVNDDTRQEANKMWREIAETIAEHGFPKKD